MPSWPGRLLGIGLWVAAAVVLVVQPTRLLLPFPWQSGLQKDYQKEQRHLVQLNVERAATTFFLLKGRYPEEMSELQSARLLASRDTFDPSGEKLVISSATASFLVEAESLDEEAPETSFTGAISGNFLLDPEFLRMPAGDSEPPLVLLD